MKNATKSKIVGAFVILFSFIAPVVVTLMVYTTLETTTSEMTINTIGIVISVFLAFGLIKFVKKRIKQRQEMGFKVSPYIILASNNTFGIIGIILLTMFINAVKGEIQTLWVVLMVITLCEIVAYLLKYLQTYFDIKDLAEQTP
jgi:uncharacterized membrane protein